MTDLLITQVGDTWTNDSQPSERNNSSKWVSVYSGIRRGWLKPAIPVMAGRTVLDSFVVGHSGGTVAQTLTLRPATESWQPGRIKASDEPAVNGSAVGADTIGALSDGEAFELRPPGLTAFWQSIADGDEFFGFRLSTSVASNQRFYATDSGLPAWEFHIVLSDLVDAPTDLRPDGGQVESLGVVAWGSTDIGGDVGEQVESRVQYDKPTGGGDPDEVSPDYDSGWVANLEQQWDLGAAHAITGAGPHFWRVFVRDADGTESEPSDWAEVTVASMPTLVRDSPVGPFGDITPRFLAHLSDGSTPRAWRAKVTGPDRSDVRAELSLQDGAVDWTVPAKDKQGRAVLREDKPGWGYLQVFPEGDWVEGVGQPPFRAEWFPLEFDDDLGVEAPSQLSVTQVAKGDPRHVWQWFRAEAADAYKLQVDDVTVVRVATDDVESLGSGWYRYEDRGEVQPLRPNKRSVRALEGDAQSVQVSVEGSHEVHGVVLLLDDGSDPIVVDGTAIGGFVRNDHRATYVTHEGEQVDIFYGMPGREIGFEGTVGRHNASQDVWAALDRIDAAKASMTRGCRVVWGSQTAYGRLRDPDWTSHDDILPNNLLHVVRFNLYQTGP